MGGEKGNLIAGRVLVLGWFRPFLLGYLVLLCLEPAGPANRGALPPWFVTAMAAYGVITVWISLRSGSAVPLYLLSFGDFGIVRLLLPHLDGRGWWGLVLPLLPLSNQPFPLFWGGGLLGWFWMTMVLSLSAWNGAQSLILLGVMGMAVRRLAGGSWEKEQLAGLTLLRSLEELRHARNPEGVSRTFLDHLAALTGARTCTLYMLREGRKDEVTGRMAVRRDPQDAVVVEVAGRMTIGEPMVPVRRDQQDVRPSSGWCPPRSARMRQSSSGDPQDAVVVEACPVYRLARHYGPELALPEECAASGIPSLITEALTQRRGVMAADLSTSDERILPKLPALRSVMVLPVQLDGESLGFALAASETPDLFAPHTTESATALAAEFAVCLRARELGHELTLLEGRDYRTRLFTHRVFQEVFQDELAAGRAQGRPLGVGLLGIDRFQEFNARYGFAEGERLLTHLGAVLAAQVKPGQVAARYGGDTFAVLFPGTDRIGGLLLVEELRKTVARSKLVRGQFVQGDGAPHRPSGERLESEFDRAEVRVTVSVGYASFPEDGDTPTRLLLAAERFLRQAKDAGRNQSLTG